MVFRDSGTVAGNSAALAFYRIPRARIKMDGKAMDNELSAGQSNLGLTTNVELLEQTKHYLQARLQHLAPDTVLAQAWDEFYRVYSSLVRRFVVAQGLRGADADDCVQGVWSTVAVKLAEFERPPQRSGLRAWLYTIVRNKATDALRTRLRYQGRHSDLPRDTGLEPCSREPDPAAALDTQWERAMLQTTLDELRLRVPEINYRCLVMRVLEGRSEAETAAALQLTPEQVRHRKYRMQRQLQSLLSVYTGHDSE